MFLAESWRSFLGSFRKAVLPSSIRRGFVWCLGGAYAFSLVVASLLAFLEPPPLPQVEVTGDEDKFAQTMMSSGSESPGFQSETKRLLAHTEGHWYLIDEREDTLIVIPERDDYAVQFPKHYQIVHSTGALKLEAPVTWDEVDESAQPEMVQLLVSTNVDNVEGTFGRVPGVTLTATRATINLEDTKRQIEWEAEKAECQPTSPRDFESSNEGLIYRGELFTWTNCDGEKGNTYTLLVAFPEHRKFYVVLQIDMPKSVPREEEEYILNHFWVDGTLLPQPRGS
jgi:hypothetical protein